MSTMMIAIDGPAASGKGTLARGLAEKLGYAHMDSGALYRLVAKAVLDSGVDSEDHVSIESLARSIRDHFNPEELKDPELRNDDVGNMASHVAVIPAVRAELMAIQQNFIQNPPGGAPGAILDGRDIGTVICPDAPVKFYVTASPEARADRRHKELQSKGIPVTYEAVLSDMRARDARDSSREAAPLKPAQDAIFIDTSAMDEQEALKVALDHIAAKQS